MSTSFKKRSPEPEVGYFLIVVDKQSPIYPQALRDIHNVLNHHPELDSKTLLLKKLDYWVIEYRNQAGTNW